MGKSLSPKVTSRLFVRIDNRDMTPHFRNRVSYCLYLSDDGVMDNSISFSTTSLNSSYDYLVTGVSAVRSLTINGVKYNCFIKKQFVNYETSWVSIYDYRNGNYKGTIILNDNNLYVSLTCDMIIEYEEIYQ